MWSINIAIAVTQNSKNTLSWKFEVKNDNEIMLHMKTQKKFKPPFLLDTWRLQDL